MFVVEKAARARGYFTRIAILRVTICLQQHLQGSLCTSWRTFNGCQWRVVFCDAQKGRWFNEEFLGRWLICASCCCTDAMLFHVVPLLPEVHLRWHSMICPWPCDDPVCSVQFIKTTSDQEAWLTQNCMIHGTGIFAYESPWKLQELPMDPKTMKNEGFKPPIYGL